MSSRPLILAVLAACGPKAPVAHGLPALAPDQLQVTMQRTSCFLGHCPAYTVTIRGDGIVVWTGATDVATIGDYREAVTPQQLRRLSAGIDRARFFELDQYGKLPCTEPNGLCSDTICSDSTDSIVTVRRGGHEHRIDNAHCEPSPADELEALIDELAQSSMLIGHKKFW